MNMERKALEQLISSLLEPEFETNRIEMIQNAVSMALIALEGNENYDEEDLQKGLDELAVQLIVNKMEREELSMFRALVSLEDNEDEDIQVIATSNPLVSAMIDQSVYQVLKDQSAYDVH